MPYEEERLEVTSIPSSLKIRFPFPNMIPIKPAWHLRHKVCSLKMQIHTRSSERP